jgi:uncharacterized membrane protein
MSDASTLYFDVIINYVIIFIDISAGIVIGISVLRALLSFFRIESKRVMERILEKDPLRNNLVWGLLLGLDFEVGSDVLRTIIVPSLADIGALAVVVGLRIVLNWSLSGKK